MPVTCNQKTETVEERRVDRLVTVRLIRQWDPSARKRVDTYGVDVFVSGEPAYRIAQYRKTLEEAGRIADAQMKIAEQTIDGLRRRIARDVERAILEA